MSKHTPKEHESRLNRSNHYTPHPRKYPDFSPKPDEGWCCRWMHCGSPSNTKLPDSFCLEVINEMAEYLRKHHCDPHLRPASVLRPDGPIRTLYVLLEDKKEIHKALKVFLFRLRRKYKCSDLVWEDIAGDPFDETIMAPTEQMDRSL